MLTRLLKLISDALDDSCFVIQVVDGSVRLTKGKAPDAFLRDLSGICKEENLTSGALRGKRQWTYVRLAISPEIPGHLQQRLRNIWHFHEPSFRTDLL